MTTIATEKIAETIESREKDPSNTRREAALAGIRAIAPILLGVVPFATISGIAAVEAGLPPWLAQFMSVFVFAGAAQLATVQLISENAAALVIVLTAVVINLRFVMYSASLAPHLQRVARWKRALLTYLLTDQAYAISITRFTQGAPLRHKGWYYGAPALLMWSVWQVGTAAGILVGAQVPPEWGLDFAIPLTFLALVVPALRDRASGAAAAAAFVTAVLAYPLPFNLGLLVGALVGITVGLATERAAPTPTSTPTPKEAAQ